MKFYVISVGIMYPGNLGAIARLCDNYDARGLILVSPQCEMNDEAYTRATNSTQYLDNAIIVDGLEDTREYVDVLVALSARVGGNKSISRSSLPLQEVSTRLAKRSGTVGFVLGREDSGLTNNEVFNCDILTFIPLPGDNPVFNVSHALAVALWEFSRERDFEVLAEHRLMSGEEKVAFMNFLEEILNYTWIRQQQYYGVLKVYREILGRALVTTREANTLIGTLRAILVRLENPNAVWDD